MEQAKQKTALVVVAHPDDEVLWCGGTILRNKDRQWEVISLCRGDDPERRQRFFAAAKVLGARAGIGDIEDGPEQEPLVPMKVEEQILELAERNQYDIIYTHSPAGEYTRHRRLRCRD